MKITENNTKPKYEEGDVVKYLPELSGFDPETELIIESSYYKETDDLSELLGVEFTPTWMYSFENSSLGASEKQVELFSQEFKPII